MVKTILRIIVAAENEIPFVETSIEEAQEVVDEILVVEHNFTHTGKSKDYVFEPLVQKRGWAQKYKNTTYLKIDLSDSIIRDAADSEAMHKNEWSMRSSFISKVNLEPRDIVFAVDADEIIYRSAYSEIIESLSTKTFFAKSFRLPMRQFFYRPDYLWENLNFESAVAGHVALLSREKIQWRDHGKRWREIVGCHFSWQLTIPQMIAKLHSYGHSADYRQFADEILLTKAVDDKEYPFEPDREFNIRQLSQSEARDLFPRSIWAHMDELAYLMTNGWKS